MNISIYGVGNFGYALLKHLDRKNKGEKYHLRAHDRNDKLIMHLDEKREHLIFHQGIKLSKRVQLSKNPEDLVKDADVLVLAVNSEATREVLQKVKSHLKKKVKIINTAKALDSKTGKRLSRVVEKSLEGVDFSYSILAGGTIASDLFKDQPLGITVASEDKESLETMHKLFSSNNLFVYKSKDLIGVEYASAFKNVVSILSGIIEGLGYSYGSQTHFISLAAGEVESMAIEVFGAKRKTFSMDSQCWGNDLWMSCTGNTRNREFGKLIGDGMGFSDAENKMKELNKTVEGANTLRILSEVLENREKFPILDLMIKAMENESDIRSRIKEITGKKYK